MTPEESPAWYSVRCIFQIEHPTGGRGYEERITLWKARSFEAAVARAEQDAHVYAEEGGPWRCQYTGFAQAFRLADEPGEGAEVFALIRGSDLDRDPYLDRFFATGDEHEGTLDGPAL